MFPVVATETSGIIEMTDVIRIVFPRHAHFRKEIPAVDFFQTVFCFLESPFEIEPATVLFLDYEASPDEIHDRLVGLYTGLGFPETIGWNIHYRYCAQPLPADIEEVQRLIATLKVDLVIIDSLGLACGGEPEAGDAIQGYFLALRALRTTSLTIHHQNKQGKLYGNVYIYNMTRNLWEIKSSASESQLNIGLFNRKTNNGPLHAPIGLGIEFDPNGTIVRPQRVVDVPDLAGDLPLYRQLMESLRGGALSVRDMAESVEKSETVVRVTLNRYKKIFVRAGGDTWGLLPSA